MREQAGFSAAMSTCASTWPDSVLVGAAKVQPAWAAKLAGLWGGEDLREAGASALGTMMHMHDEAKSESMEVAAFQ